MTKHAVEKSSSQIISQKKKKWYQAISPEFNNTPIGEVISAEPDTLKGRTIKISSSAFFNNQKKQHYLLKFKILDFKDSNALAYINDFEISPSFIHRLARNEKNKIEMSSTKQLKDSKAQVKPLFITHVKTSNKILAYLMKKAEKFITDYCKEKTYFQAIEDILAGTLQKSLKDSLKKTYPLTVVEIRRFTKLSSYPQPENTT